jgi:hypothetical protein
VTTSEYLLLYVFFVYVFFVYAGYQSGYYGGIAMKTGYKEMPTADHFLIPAQ